MSSAAGLDVVQRNELKALAHSMLQVLDSIPAPCPSCTALRAQVRAECQKAIDADEAVDPRRLLAALDRAGSGAT